MIAVNYSTIRNNLKDYCDKATHFQETVIVTRKNEKNIVLMSLDKYNQLEKAARNNEYLAMLDRGIAQLEAGKGQEHELIEVDEWKNYGRIGHGMIIFIGRHKIKNIKTNQSACKINRERWIVRGNWQAWAAQT